MEHGNYLHNVRQQYEQYPYPYRDPHDETKRLIRPSIDFLDLVNFYCFEGKQSFKNNFQILIAGGGTGDSTIFLAEQLKHCDAHITHLDLSDASIAIAKERAHIRGLENITFIHDSLLELPHLALGSFDYINCSGVLHHLDDPTAGLAAISQVLKDDGAMALMVYGAYGREGLYQMQALMRLINEDKDDVQQKVDNTKAILQSLPSTNWFKRGEDFIGGDHTKLGDIGIYDMFLHEQDRAYTVPQIYAWIEEVGLVFRDFFVSHGRTRLAYSPQSFIKDTALNAKIAMLPIKQQQAMAEIIVGTLIKHAFFVSKKDYNLPSTIESDNIPFFASTLGINSQRDILQQMHAQKEQNAITITLDHAGITQHVELKNDEQLLDIVSLIDGKRTIEQIAKELHHCSKEKFFATFDTLFDAMRYYDWMLLRHKDVPAFVIP